MMTERGVTLTELLVASALAAVVAVGISTLESGRAKIADEVLLRSGFGGQSAVALATVEMARRISQADRAILNNATGEFQLRIPVGCMGAIPPPGCFDIAGNYQWDQYRLNGTQLRLYTSTGAGCGTLQVLSTEVTALSFNFIDFADEPPGGIPVPDNNLVEYAVRWQAGARNRDFLGRIVSRAVTYSSVNTTGTDSGTGMAPTAVAPPPAACP